MPAIIVVKEAKCTALSPLTSLAEFRHDHKGAPAGNVQRFLTWVLGPEGQAIVSAYGESPMQQAFPLLITLTALNVNWH